MDTHSHRIVVPRSARYWTSIDVGGTTGDGLREVWIVLHGYGQLAAGFLESAAVLDKAHRLVVAPEALSRFYLEDHKTVGATWMTREDRDHEMEDTIRYLDLVHDAVFELVGRADVTLTVLGYSQGAAAAARWTVRGRGVVDHLILWGGALPPDVDDEASIRCLKALRLSLVVGNRDALVPEAARATQRARLERHGVSYAELGFDGGHRLDDDTLEQLAVG